MAEEVSKFVKGVLQKSAHGDAVVQTKVLDRTLLLDAVRPDNTVKRQERLEKRRREKSMPRRERKQRRMFEVPQEQHNYQFFLPLHQLWQQYMTELLGPNPIASSARLLKADFNGALLKVTEARCASYYGIAGIVLQETTNAFTLITPQNKLRVIPKDGNVFSFQIGNSVVTLYGHNLIYRPSDRTAKKIKAKNSSIEVR